MGFMSEQHSIDMFKDFCNRFEAIQNDFKTLGGNNMKNTLEVVSKTELVEMTKTLKEVQQTVESDKSIINDLYKETQEQEKLIEELSEHKENLYKLVKSLIEENTELKSDLEWQCKYTEELEDAGHERESLQRMQEENDQEGCAKADWT